VNKAFRAWVALVCRKAAGVPPRARDARKNGWVWKWYAYDQEGKVAGAADHETLMDGVFHDIRHTFELMEEWVQMEDCGNQVAFSRKQFGGTVVITRGCTIRKGDGPRERQEGRVCEWVKVRGFDPPEVCGACVPQTPECKGCEVS
jgi:hypothetical protein